jgi:RadC-like JAB domain
VKQRDDHKPSQPTVPYPRPLLLSPLQKPWCFQRNARSDRFVRSHPSGDPTPSQADIQMTKAIVEIARPLGIAVHDHIIVGRNGHASLKGMKLM